MKRRAHKMEDFREKPVKHSLGGSILEWNGGLKPGKKQKVDVESEKGRKTTLS